MRLLLPIFLIIWERRELAVEREREQSVCLEEEKEKFLLGREKRNSIDQSRKWLAWRWDLSQNIRPQTADRRPPC